MKGNSSQGKKNVDLIDLMFSWSLEDIFNEHLYKDKVDKIPESFQSEKHYLGSFVFPLLEETRAELSSSMKFICRAPFAEVVSVKEPKRFGKLLYNIQIDSWKNRFYIRGKEPYRTFPGDVFIITEVKPDSILDLQQSGRTWALGLVTKFSENKNSLNVEGSTSISFIVKASKDVGLEDGLKKSLYVIFLMNITTNNRVWDSLNSLKNVNVIKEVLCTNSMVEEICNQCCLYSNAICAERYAMRLSPVLNESQRLAVLSSLCMMQCNHKSSVELIWGPPGTGKTKTVSMLLWAVLGMNYRVLTCAPTNVAITELASRVVKLVKEKFEKESKRSELFCSLGDFLLFGNKDRLKIGSELEDIYLDYRIDRLSDCFSQLTGWNHCFTSMINFLEDCVSLYHIFLENILCNKNESKKENQSCDEVKSFGEFLRVQFKSIALPLRRCVQIFCTHVPKRVIVEHNFQNIVFLVELLDTFESLLCRHDMVSAELEELFSCTEVVQECPYSLVHTPTLQYVRTQLLCVLRSVRNSLDHLKLPKNKNSIRKFCFQWASLIFCTASSSYKLHSVKMEPLNLLVIDEAAQLKECESTIALQLSGIRHAILIGDEYQLRATVTSKVSDEAGFGRSLFERLSLWGHSKHLLNIQYRMHSSIFSFPNSRFYLNEILDAPNVKSKSHVKHYLPGPMFGPYSFISVFGGREELDVGHSRKNLVEVAVALKIVQKLYKAYSGSKQKISIGIVSPYASQVMTVQEKLGRKYNNLDGFTVKVKSIDGFQGGEEDIIIISTVRSNRSSSIGFLSNPQRTNVALTRARHCLWILGSGKTLENSKSVWEDVVHDAKLRQCFFNADEDKDLARAILEVKEQLVQLDDLLEKDSILFRTSRWKVLLSDNFWKSFGKLKSSQTKKLVSVFLLKLSTGWRPTEKSKDLIAKFSPQILYHFKVEDRYIVWTVDVEKVSKYVQVLKIWDILPLEDVHPLVECLNGMFRMFTDDFLNHCKAKCLEGDFEIPLSWVSSSYIIQYKNLSEIEPDGKSSAVAFDGRTDFDYSSVERSLLRRKFYSLSYLVVNHLLSGGDCSELDLPCQVTDQELEIILFPKTTFVVGRSSLERTSLLTMKLFQKEQQHYLASGGFYDKRRNITIDNKWKNNVGESIAKTKEYVLRQIFITGSPKSCAVVKQHVSHLKSLTCGGTFSAESSSIDLDDVDDAARLLDIPDNFVNIPPEAYPLVITFGKFLVMLDGTLGDSYFKRFHNIQKHTHTKTGTSSTFALQAFISTKEVNYDRFCSSYWPHFNVELTKKLDASTVFTEIIFHIKGGMETIEVCDAKVSREDYVLLPRAQFPTLSTKRREKIYDIFLDYEKEKMENGEFDLADLVIDLHRRLKTQRYEGEKMDFVYVDDVQHLTKREITLFKYICTNASTGFVFSGDMAQTIARGANFRFQDIRTLFYKEFILGSRNDGGTEEGQISDLFHLSQSLHTHGGILNIGRSVIDLLFRFFPLSIDILCPETCANSLINNELPILLEPVKNENAIISLFGNSGNAGKSTVSFGAEQVILVRDDFAREEIIALVGKQTIVLTIMECQGLEFQDVLLYNFFGTSPLKSHWRIIYEYMKEQDMLDSSSLSSFSSFDRARQNGLCLELKLLYVAITRSRKRLWISENAKEFSNPMFDYWKKLCLVQIRRVDDSLVQVMQVGSSEEDWRSRGIKLYCEGRYEMAMMCFTRAGDEYRKIWAMAASLRTTADHLRGSNPEMSHDVLSKAAELFNSIGKDESAAQCFIELKEYEKAGTIYFEKYGDSRLDDACNSFLLAGCYKRAAEACARGNDFSKCLSICTSRKFFDLGLQFIQSRRQHVTPEVSLVTKSQELRNIEHTFLEKCALHYHELQDNKSMMKFVRAFHSFDSKRLFLKNLNCFDELLLLEKESGNLMEAAAIAKLKGDILLEVDLLEKSGHYRDASMLILFYISSKSRWASGNKGWPLKQFRQKEKLLERAKILAKKVSNDFCEFVSTEANVLSNQEKSFSELEKYLTDSYRQQNLGCIIFSTRTILDAHLRSNTSVYEWKDDFVMDLMKLSEESISQNCISFETLIYFWSLWKEKIASIIEYLGSLKTQDINENMRFGEFCLNYFGVWKETDNQNSIFLLLNPDAEWAKRIDDRVLQRKRDLVGMDASQFLLAAKAYWCSEVLSVGMKILEKLQALCAFSIMNSHPKSCQRQTAIHIFEVTKFLTECKFLESSMDEKTLTKLFDIGLQSISTLKNVSPDLGMVNGSQKISRIMHDFLVKCAIYYHVLKNKRAMMKFVRAFDSMNSRRTLLRNLDCFDELLLLEEESGNFVEAATIANLKGDLLLEADLLEKAGHYKDASMLILFYVLANSLWASGNKGWPLKQFRQKVKLLTKAKSLAVNVSNIFHESVCIEANILSNQATNLFEMKQNFDASLRQKNLRGEMLSAWKILDTHLRLKPSKYVWEVEPVTNPTKHSEEMISQNQVSIETLVYFWNYWKAKILNIFDYLRCLETKDVNENTSCEDFCLSYMGVRKEFTAQNSIFILVNSDFDWVKEINDGSLQRTGKFIRINATQFVAVARSYWCSELVSAGTKVLEMLEALRMLSVRNSLSIFCQSMPALHFFEVTEFLMGLKFLQLSANKIFQKFFDMRSQFIQYCTRHLFPDACTVDGNHGTYEIEHVFLEKCAVHYHELQDKRKMMKFVKAFHSMDSKRAFLKTMDCFDELLLLEEEQGNFVEAASIARWQGDFFLEVDLLQKAGHFKDAAMLILSYVLANSLWSPESKGWPLKQFMQKEDLLIKAKSFAHKHSDIFYKYVCTEANILLNQESSLSEMKESLSASQRNNSIIGEILSARKILDAHFNLDTSKFESENELVIELMNHSEDRISRNQVSVETLVCFWNFWKEKIVNIFKYLGYLEIKDVAGYTSCENFCLSYLGVRKKFVDQSIVYHLLNSGSDWVRIIDDGSLQRSGKVVGLDARQFAAAAWSYWSSEVFSVGMKVLENLVALYMFSVRNSSLFYQSLTAIRTFEIAKFLMESELLKKSPDNRVLQENFELCTKQFFENVFPLDWSKPMTENMITLRRAELSRNILAEIIFGIINSESELTYGKIGRVVMILFGSGKLSTGLYEMIENFFNANPSWTAFIDEFKGYKIGSEFADQSAHEQVTTGEGSMVLKLHDALRSTYNVDRRVEIEYISPNCFLYLVERFIILVSNFQGCLFMTKSSFIEWLIFQELEIRPSTRVVTDMKSSVKGAFDFVVSIVQQLLVNKYETMEWIKKSDINLDYYPHLVLRLVIVICLLCLNSGKYFDVLHNLLHRIDISSQLPWAFFEAIQKKRTHSCKFVNIFATALAKIENPLVIVSLDDNHQRLFCAEAIVISRNDTQCKEKLLRMLFPENVKDTRDHVCGSEPKMLKSCTVGLSLNSNSRRKSNKLPSSKNYATASVQDLKISIDNRNCDPGRNYGYLYESSESSKLVEEGKYGNIRSCSTYSLKMESEKKNNHIKSAASQFFCKNSCNGYDNGNLFEEVHSMINERKQLSSALDVRDQELENNISTVGETFKRLQQRRPKLEPFLNGQILQNDKDSMQGASQASRSQKKKEDERSKAKENGDSKKGKMKASFPKPVYMWEPKATTTGTATNRM